VPAYKKINAIFALATSWILFSQGMSGITALAVNYFYKNTLHASPAELSSITSLAAIPWAIKPLYGFMSDAFPILSYRRRPYILLSGLLGSLCWLLFFLTVHDMLSGLVLLFFASMAVAISNVMSEAMVVERSRGEDQGFAATLQSMIWGANALGALISAFLGGYLLTFMAPRSVFLVGAIFPTTLIFIAFIAPEVRQGPDPIPIKERIVSLFVTFKRPEIWKPALFIFLLNATPSTGSSWFYFYTNVLKFDSEFLGTINVVGSMFNLLAVFIFQVTLLPPPAHPPPRPRCPARRSAPSSFGPPSPPRRLASSSSSSCSG
jgi:MFS family permease